MTTLPDVPQTAAAPPQAPPPDVDTLFPLQSADELFPASVERERTRQQSFGTSPIQDLIFGDTSVNPVARVLDAFGQGAKQGWGAEPLGLSKESTDALKKIGIFNDYEKGQRDIIKSANEVLFRSAATFVVPPVVRGLAAAISGTQAGIASVGSELGGTFIDKAVRAVNAAPSYLLEDTPRVGLGTEKLGREAAAMIEAFPAGLRQPTGAPGAGVAKMGREQNAAILEPHSAAVPPMERVMAADQAVQEANVGHAETNIVMAEIERARELGVIGQGEAAYFGTRPAEVRPPISSAQAPEPVAPKVEGSVEAPREAAATEPGVSPEATTDARPVVPPEMRAAIADDVTQKLVAAGRPAEEAAAAAEIIASHYEARAERFGGALGTAEELYKTEGADIRPGKGVAPVKSEPIRPERSGDAGAAEPVPPKELELNQIKRGQINIREGEVKPIITLFKDANESTFIHETAHGWLEEFVRDAGHEKAPALLRDDAEAVRSWLGVHSLEDIKTSHHEKFARGFERYMMEGKAPSQALANVFEKFKNWLTKIYQTVNRLKSPITDEVRGVFDRLLTMHPSEVKIEPEGPPKTFADIHEADALHTQPEAARPVTETLKAERDMLANEHIPEEHDARLEGIASGTSRREAGGPQPIRDGNEAPRTEEAGNNQASGAVGEGGSNAPAESPRPSVSPRTEVPVSPQEAFKPASAPLMDKAGNIRLENVNAPEDVLQVLRDSAERNSGFIDERRGVVTDAQALSLADAMGMDVKYLETKRIGEAFNKEEIFALEKMLIQSATSVRDAMASGDVLAYADAKARLLMIHDVVQGKASAARAEAGRALQAFAALKKMKGSSEAHNIANYLKDNSDNKTLFQLEREMKLGATLDTPAKVSAFVNESIKPTWQDMAIELWLSFLLSGPKTHVANVMGNTISGIVRPLETSLAAGIGKVRNILTGTEDRVHIGEAKAELFGMVQGAREGVVGAYHAFRTEEPQLTPVSQTERGHAKALPSFTLNAFGNEIQIGGKQLRIPLRMLGAEDEFFKSVSFRGDINRQAVATATKEGLTGEKFNNRVAELSMTPTEEMVANAKGVAEYQTFQTPLGKVGRAVQNFSNAHPLAKIIIPFVRTPLNLLKYAGERTPLGLFSEGVRDNLAGKNGAVARDTQIARIALGSIVGIAAFEMAHQGLITGGGPGDKNKKALMREDGWQDYSVRVGDMYYRYNRLDPFSVILGVAADAYEIYHAMGDEHPDRAKIPAMAFAAISQNVLNRASLSGISDAIQAVSDHDRYGQNYLKKMAGTIVPAFAAQSAQALDPVTRETRTVFDNLKARLPVASETLQPKRTVWGEPKVREGGLGPDVASPIVASRAQNDPVNKALLDANYFPGHLTRKIHGIELTDQQYDDYARVAGRTAKMRLDAIVSQPGFSQWPESARKEVLQKTITSARSHARDLTIMQSINSENDIMKKAMDAKIAKQAGR